MKMKRIWKKVLWNYKSIVALLIGAFMIACSSNGISREQYLTNHPDSNLDLFEKLVGNDYVHTPYFDISLVKMNVYPTNKNIIKRLYGFPTEKPKVYLIEMFFAICPNIYEASEIKDLTIKFSFDSRFDAGNSNEPYNTFLLAPYESLLMCFDTKKTVTADSPILGYDPVVPQCYTAFSDSENELIMAYWRRRTVFIGIKNEEKIEEMLPLIFKNNFYLSLGFDEKIINIKRKYILNYPLEINMKDPIKSSTLEEINDNEVNIFIGNHWLLEESDLTD